MTGDYEPTLPASGPSTASLAERDAFAKLVADSLTSTRSSAETWRTGLAAFITLVGAGVVIEGRDFIDHLAFGWRIAVTLLLFGGLVLAVIGLWQVLAAQAGRPDAITLAQIHEKYHSVAAFQVAMANAAASRIRRSQRWVAIALALLVLGVSMTWWAPESQGSPPAYLKVTQGTAIVCGELESADGGRLRLKVKGAHDLVVIDNASVSNIEVVAACP